MKLWQLISEKRGYTFRPRRRPRRQRDKREKYHHALKALAIREQKIHIVGSPELKLEGTPVYLDVEGLPDHDYHSLNNEPRMVAEQTESGFRRKKRHRVSSYFQC
jgi:hypothetical protein